MTMPSSRREFLKRASALSVAASATPLALSLAAIGEAAAATATDYKALVCVFLYGGNDHANTLVPYDGDSHAAYTRLRSAIATPRDALASTVLAPTTALPGGRQYALAPQLAGLMPIFHAGQLGVLLNVGNLVAPLTKAQYGARSVPLPPKLFSHNDQQSFWQSSGAEGSTTGWGGRIGDLFASSNGNATFTCVNVSGNAVYLAGSTAVQYQVTTTGSVPITGISAPLFGSQACADTLRALVSASRSHLFESEHARITRRSIEADAQLRSSLATVPPLATVFPTGNSLAAQLQMVARMIAARESTGARRQVFLVSLGGFDTHDDLTQDHPVLLNTLAGALTSFHAATLELGVANQVTTFTGSDFGRTTTTNGDGSDHGWGSMHFVMGGAVRGRACYGTAPVVASDGPDDVGQGRLLPTLAVDQLASTLARWFGLSATETAAVLPNLRNFSQTDLGFLTT